MIRLEKAEPMPPKLDPKEPTERLNMFIPRSLMQQINEWRAAHGFVTKSEAARQLIEKGLFSSASQKGRKND